MATDEVKKKMGGAQAFLDAGADNAALTVRRAELPDLDAVYLLEKDNSVRPYSYSVMGEIFNNSVVFVADYHKKSVGYAAVSVVFEDAELINIVVDGAQRGRGIGKALLSAVTAEARIQGAKRVLLEVEDDNFAAIRLYQKFGFRRISTREKYYGDAGALIMECCINIQ